MRSVTGLFRVFALLGLVIVGSACTKEEARSAPPQPAQEAGEQPAQPAATATTTGWTVRDLLAMSLENAPLMFAAPSLESTYGQFENYLTAEPMAQFADMMEFSPEKLIGMAAEGFGLSGVQNLAQLLERTGLDGAKPLCISVAPEAEEKGLVFLPVMSVERLLEALEFEAGAPVEVTIGGEPCKGAYDNGDVAYVVYKDYVLIGDSPKTLERAAQNIANPAEVYYGTPELPAAGSELVLRTNLAALQSVFDMPLLPTQVDLMKPMLEPLAAAVDESVLAVEVAESVVRLRVAMHSTAPQAAPPGPLELAKALPGDALAVAGLRLSPGLRAYIKETAAAAAPAGGSEMQMVQGMITTLDSVLGDEVAGALMGIDPLSGPNGVLIAQSSNPKTLEGLVGMTVVGRSGTDYKGCQITGAEEVPGLGLGLFWTSTDKHFLLATSEDMLHDAIDRLTAATPPADGFAADLGRMAKANHGFFCLNGGKLMEILTAEIGADAVPQVDLGNVLLTFEQYPTWLQAAVESPNLAPVAAALLPALARARESARRASSQNNLKEWGLVYLMYANENAGERYPVLSPVPGNLMARGSAIYPEYLTDPSITRNPGSGNSVLFEISSQEDADRMIDDSDYMYLSYAVVNEEEGLAWAAAYRKAIEEGADLDHDFQMPDGRVIYRLRQGIERFYITDINDPSSAARAQSSIPIMWERPGAWSTDGINVLYLDGHVEFVKKGTFPYTEAFMNALFELDALGNQ